MKNILYVTPEVMLSLKDRGFSVRNDDYLYTSRFGTQMVGICIFPYKHG